MASDSRVVRSRPTGGSPLRPSEEAVLPFPQMLYKELNGGSNPDMIWWSEKGNSFTVSNSKRFERKVIAKWPKCNTRRVFASQLTMYGFCKTKGRSTSQFRHPKFLKDRPDLLCFIRWGERPNTIIPEDHRLPPPLPVSSQATPQPVPPILSSDQMLDMDSMEMAGDNRVAQLRPAGGSPPRPSEEAIPTFPHELYQMPNDEENSNVIRWPEEGDPFTVFDCDRFEQDVIAEWSEYQSTIVPEDSRFLPSSQPVLPVLPPGRVLDVNSMKMAGDSRAAQLRPAGGSPLRPSEEAIPKFLQMLYDELNGEKNNHLIWWSASRDSFVVSNSNRFEQEVIAKWPKYNTRSMFHQQLTMHGFCETEERSTFQFRHPKFLKDRPDLLYFIRWGERPNTIIPEDHRLPSPLPVPPQSTLQQILPNSPPGQIPDPNSLPDDIPATERRQKAISSELNELRMEVMASRERHEKRQDMINRIAKFPAGIFGSTAALLLGGGGGNTHDTFAHITFPTPSASELFALINNHPESTPPQRFCASTLIPSQTIPPVPNASHPTNSTAVPQLDPALLFNTSAINASDTTRKDVAQGTISEVMKSPQSMQMLVQALQNSSFSVQPPSSSAQPVTMDHPNNQLTAYSPVQYSSCDHRDLIPPASSSPTGVTAVAHSSSYLANSASYELLGMLNGQDTHLHETRERTQEVTDSINFVDSGIGFFAGQFGFDVDNLQNRDPLANVTGGEVTNLDHANLDLVDFDFQDIQDLLYLFPDVEGGKEDRERARKLTTSLNGVASDTNSVQQLSLEAPIERARKKKKSDVVA